jgi:hypothetical protein
MGVDPIRRPCARYQRRITGAVALVGKTTPTFRADLPKIRTVKWFAENYPKIKSNTVIMHVNGMSTNNKNRRHHPSARPGAEFDLLVKLGPDQFRLWDPASDPPPVYKETLDSVSDGEFADGLANVDSEDAIAEIEGAREFAYERDLQNYLVKNLSLIEPGLKLYEEEDITGVQYDAGGRIIDILAVDRNGGYVVIELKVSRGYDRVVGQLLRYMDWVEHNLASGKPVRGVIVANSIADDLKLACSRVNDVKLIEYEISFTLRPT